MFVKQKVDRHADPKVVALVAGRRGFIEVVSNHTLKLRARGGGYCQMYSSQLPVDRKSSSANRRFFVGGAACLALQFGSLLARRFESRRRLGSSRA